MERIRAFIAVDLPPATREAVEDVARRLQAGAVEGVRWVRPDGVHLTLKFLGTIGADSVPAVSESLARQLCRFLQEARVTGLSKVPGVSEALDWAQALMMLQHDHLDRDTVAQTLGCLVKDAEDLQRLQGPALEELLSRV